MVRPKRKRPRRVARCPWHHWYKVQWREAATGPVAAWQRRRQRFHDGANKKKKRKETKNESDLALNTTDKGPTGVKLPWDSGKWWYEGRRRKRTRRTKRRRRKKERKKQHKEKRDKRENVRMWGMRGNLMTALSSLTKLAKWCHWIGSFSYLGFVPSLCINWHILPSFLAFIICSFWLNGELNRPQNLFSFFYYYCFIIFFLSLLRFLVSFLLLLLLFFHVFFFFFFFIFYTFSFFFFFSLF